MHAPMNETEIGDHLFLAMNAAADMIVFAVDSKGIYTSLAGKGLEKNKLDPVDFVGKPAVDAHVSGPEIAQLVRQAIRGQVSSGTVKLRGRYYEARFLPMEDPVGGTVGFAVDVTERHLKELIERERKRISDVLFDEAKDAIFIIDRDFNVTKTNKAMDRLYPNHFPLQGQSCYSVYYKDQICPGCPAKEAFRTGKKQTAIDFRPSATSKTGIWLEQNALPVFDPLTEKVVSVVCTLRDISEQKLAEEQVERFRRQVERQMHELRKSEEKLRTILETNTAAICFFDNDRAITYCNAAYEQFTGYSKAELLHMHTTDVIDFEEKTTKEYLKLREEVFTGQTDRIRSLLKHKKKDGSAAWADICITTFHAEDPKDSHYVAIVFDDTERHNLLEQLQQMQAK